MGRHHYVYSGDTVLYFWKNKYTDKWDDLMTKLEYVKDDTEEVRYILPLEFLIMLRKLIKKDTELENEIHGNMWVKDAIRKIEQGYLITYEWSN
jgi:hypothetical protein